MHAFVLPSGDEQALDVGTGAGALALALAPIVREVVGVDRVPVGTFAGGAAVPLGTDLVNEATIGFNVIPRLGGVLPNLAHLNAYDGAVTDDATVAFNRPVISIDKTGPTPSPVTLGPSGVTYSVQLTNSGGVDAVNVQFTDAGPVAGSYALGRSTLRRFRMRPAAAPRSPLASIPAGQTRTVTYRYVGAVAAATGSAGEYRNEATVTTFRDPANNIYTNTVADVATLTVEQPRITVDKQLRSASPISATDGETITYAVTLTNTSNVVANQISGTDVFSFPGTFLPGTCTGGMTAAAPGTFTLASLAAGASASCEYQVRINGDRPAGTLTNTATVTWRNGFGQTGVYQPDTATIEPFRSTDSASVTAVAPQLALAKGPDADSLGNTIPNGGLAAYTITLVNAGVVAARDVVLADTLPRAWCSTAIPRSSRHPPASRTP